MPESAEGTQGVKAARNQALFREVNERIADVAEAAGHLELLCECASDDCTETIHMSLAEYEYIRSAPTRFPIAKGHEVPEVENVVEEFEGYAVVQKMGAAAEESVRLDPRTR
jgi:hypothetical protein